jgi:DinB superfamily
MINADQSKSNLHPQLVEIVRQLDDASERAGSIAGHLDAEQLRRRPRTGGWSIAECLVHLSLSSRAELVVLDDVFARAKQEQSSNEAKYKMDLLGRLLKWTLEPPPRSWSKIKTTEEFRPPNADLIEQALPDFLSLQEQLKDRVERANGLALDKIKVASPFNRRIRYNLLSCFHLILAHERRHLWQAEQAGK